MKPLSDKTETVTPSPIRQMFNLAYGRKDSISFTVGEPDFATPQNIVEAAVLALRNGEHRYAPNAGILPLRQAISRQTEKTHGIAYSPENQVIVTAGGMEALMLAMLTILNPDDELILADPCWTNYSRQVQICSAVPKFVPVKAENNFLYDPDELEASITVRTKAFLINSPANPTGGIASEEALKKLAEIALRHDLYVISDEVYNRLLYDGRRAFSIASCPGMAERTVVVNSFSKTYAMTGWRVGYAVGPAPVIQKMVMLQENVAACVNSAAQYGALAALKDPQVAVADMTESYARRRDLIIEEFNTIPGLRCYTPQGAFYTFVDISGTGMKASEFAVRLLDETGVIVVPGHAFGKNSNQYIRVSFATSDIKIKEGCSRIRKFMYNRIQKKNLTGRAL